MSVLEEAASRGELSAAVVDWSVVRLSGRVRRGHPRLAAVDRSNDILRAAAEVIRRRGYHHTTIEEIAKELDLTRAGIYHYFASKEDILAAICDRGMTSAEKAVEAAIEGAADPYQQLKSLLERYADVILTEDGVNVALRHIEELPESVRRDLRRRSKRIQRAIAEVLERGVSAGVFNVSETKIAVFGLLGALNWMHIWYRPRGRRSAEEIRELQVKRLMNGVAARPDSKSSLLSRSR
jgi:AcrR family transcriptional regulator